MSDFFSRLSGSSILFSGGLVVLLISMICAMQAIAHRRYRAAFFSLAGAMVCGAFTMWVYALPVENSSHELTSLALVSASVSIWFILLTMVLLLMNARALVFVMLAGVCMLLAHGIAPDLFTRRIITTVTQLVCSSAAIVVVIANRQKVSRFAGVLAVTLFSLFAVSLTPQMLIHIRVFFDSPEIAGFGQQAQVHAWRALVWTASSVLAYAMTMALVFSLMAKKLLAKLDSDFLTGLHSRRKVFESGGEWFRQPGKKVSAILIDIDHFKVINDRLGHLAGDEALRLCAARMREVARASDAIVARYGGEEFCVLLPDVDLQYAQAIGTRLCEHVASKPFDVFGQELSITISVGVAARDPSMSLNGLLAWADKCLYQAKSDGRNCVVAELPKGMVSA